MPSGSASSAFSLSKKTSLLKEAAIPGPIIANTSRVLKALTSLVGVSGSVAILRNLERTLYINKATTVPSSVRNEDKILSKSTINNFVVILLILNSRENNDRR